jgi:hypothetical protein
MLGSTEGSTLRASDGELEREAERATLGSTEGSTLRASDGELESLVQLKLLHLEHQTVS